MNDLPSTRGVEFGFDFPFSSQPRRLDTNDGMNGTPLSINQDQDVENKEGETLQLPDEEDASANFAEEQTSCGDWAARASEEVFGEFPDNEHCEMDYSDMSPFDKLRGRLAKKFVILTSYCDRHRINVDYPLFVVIGEQSSGKSSLVNVLCQKAIAFCTPGTGTRCFVKYVLKNSDEEDVFIVHIGEERRRVGKARDVFAILEKEMRRIDSSCGFSDQVIEVEHRGRDTGNMTLIDTPGITPGDLEGYEQIKFLLSGYLQRPNAVPVIIREFREKQNDTTVQNLECLFEQEEEWRDVRQPIFVINKCDKDFQQHIKAGFEHVEQCIRGAWAQSGIIQEQDADSKSVERRGYPYPTYFCTLNPTQVALRDMSEEEQQRFYVEAPENDKAYWQSVDEGIPPTVDVNAMDGKGCRARDYIGIDAVASAIYERMVSCVKDIQSTVWAAMQYRHEELRETASRFTLDEFPEGPDALDRMKRDLKEFCTTFLKTQEEFVSRPGPKFRVEEDGWTWDEETQEFRRYANMEGINLKAASAWNAVANRPKRLRTILQANKLVDLLQDLDTKMFGLRAVVRAQAIYTLLVAIIPRQSLSRAQIEKTRARGVSSILGSEAPAIKAAVAESIRNVEMPNQWLMFRTQFLYWQGQRIVVKVIQSHPFYKDHHTTAKFYRPVIRKRILEPAHIVLKLRARKGLSKMKEFEKECCSVMLDTIQIYSSLGAFAQELQNTVMQSIASGLRPPDDRFNVPKKSVGRAGSATRIPEGQNAQVHSRAQTAPQRFDINKFAEDYRRHTTDHSQNWDEGTQYTGIVKALMAVTLDPLSKANRDMNRKYAKATMASRMKDLLDSDEGVKIKAAQYWKTLKYLTVMRGLEVNTTMMTYLFTDYDTNLEAWKDLHKGTSALMRPMVKEMLETMYYPVFNKNMGFNGDKSGRGGKHHNLEVLVGQMVKMTAPELMPGGLEDVTEKDMEMCKRACFSRQEIIQRDRAVRALREYERDQGVLFKEMGSVNGKGHVKNMTTLAAFEEFSSKGHSKNSSASPRRSSSASQRRVSSARKLSSTTDVRNLHNADQNGHSKNKSDL